MGCFEGTCAFSRTAIRPGNEVLMVVIKPNCALNTYDLSNAVNRYNTFDSLPGLSPFRFIGVGEYDWYGGIGNEVIKEEYSDWWDYQFLVHRSVAEGLLGEPLDLGDLEPQVCRLINLAFLTRVQLATNLVGCQHVVHEELDLQEQLLELTQQVITQHRQELTLEDHDA